MHFHLVNTWQPVLTVLTKCCNKWINNNLSNQVGASCQPQHHRLVWHILAPTYSQYELIHISWTLRIFLVHASQLDWWEEVYCKLLALNDFYFGSLFFVKLNQNFGHGQRQNARRFRSVLMATYSNHNISVFATFFYGGCIWCSNVTPTPWKLFKGAQYNHYLLRDGQLNCVIFVIEHFNKVLVFK